MIKYASLVVREATLTKYQGFKAKIMFLSATYSEYHPQIPVGTFKNAFEKKNTVKSDNVLGSGKDIGYNRKHTFYKHVEILCQIKH